MYVKQSNYFISKCVQMIARIIKNKIVIVVLALGVFFALVNVIFVYSGVKAAEEVIVYVSEGCPHCQIVEQFIDKNDLADNLVIKNVTLDDDVGQEFTDFLDQKEVPYEERGVPMMIYSDNEWISGDTPIIDVLKERFDLHESVNNEPSDITDVDEDRQLGTGDMLAVTVGAFVLAIIVGYGIFNAIDARRKY